MNSVQLDADSEMENRQSVFAGKVVTTHELPISFNGWVGERYLLINPKTGAYKIAGGSNGGELLQDVSIIGIFTLTDLIITVVGFLGKIFGTAAALLSGYSAANESIYGNHTENIESLVLMLSMVLLFTAMTIDYRLCFSCGAPLVFSLVNTANGLDV